MYFLWRLFITHLNELIIKKYLKHVYQKYATNINSLGINVQEDLHEP